jgi:hypothetical protein
MKLQIQERNCQRTTGKQNNQSIHTTAGLFPLTAPFGNILGHEKDQLTVGRNTPSNKLRKLPVNPPQRTAPTALGGRHRPGAPHGCFSKSPRLWRLPLLIPNLHALTSQSRRFNTSHPSLLAAAGLQNRQTGRGKDATARSGVSVLR